MAEDWAADVKKYAPDADPAVIAGIIRYCGIALQKRDSSLVALADREEVALARRPRSTARGLRRRLPSRVRRSKVPLIQSGSIRRGAGISPFLSTR